MLQDDSAIGHCKGELLNIDGSDGVVKIVDPPCLRILSMQNLAKLHPNYF